MQGNETYGHMLIIVVDVQLRLFPDNTKVENLQHIILYAWSDWLEHTVCFFRRNSKTYCLINTEIHRKIYKEGPPKVSIIPYVSHTVCWTVWWWQSPTVRPTVWKFSINYCMFWISTYSRIYNNKFQELAVWTTVCFEFCHTVKYTTRNKNNSL